MVQIDVGSNVRIFNMATSKWSDGVLFQAPIPLALLMEKEK